MEKKTHPTYIISVYCLLANINVLRLQIVLQRLTYCVTAYRCTAFLEFINVLRFFTLCRWPNSLEKYVYVYVYGCTIILNLTLNYQCFLFFFFLNIVIEKRLPFFLEKLFRVAGER